MADLVSSPLSFIVSSVSSVSSSLNSPRTSPRTSPLTSPLNSPQTSPLNPPVNPPLTYPLSPPRITRALDNAVCPPAPRRKRIVEDRRPSFFTPRRRITFEDIDDVKIQMVKNYLSNFPSGTFRHSEEVSKKVVLLLECKCERISEDSCIYTR